MAFGSSPFGKAPFGAADSVTATIEYGLGSLGYVVNMGGPWVVRHDSLHALTTLGSVVTFGAGFVGVGNGYSMRSLGVVGRFGEFTTPGNATALLLSLGPIVRLGNWAAIPFLSYASGPYAPSAGVTLVGYQSGPYVRPPGITFVERATS